MGTVIGNSSAPSTEHSGARLARDIIEWVLILALLVVTAMNLGLDPVLVAVISAPVLLIASSIIWQRHIARGPQRTAGKHSSTSLQSRSGGFDS